MVTGRRIYHLRFAQAARPARRPDEEEPGHEEPAEPGYRGK
jgi:hypothetical protein